MMILKVAWRNIWRSRVRSLVVIGAVLIGVWSFIAMMALSLGMTGGYVDNAIRYQTSHIQIHHPEFNEDKELAFMIEDDLTEDLEAKSEIVSTAYRSIANGMIRSSRSARGVAIKGVIPEQEERLSQISEKIVEGTYFQEDKNNQIIVSRELAEKLKVRLRKKVVIQFQDLNKEIVASSFRIVGMFSTGNTMADLASVFVLQDDLNELIGKDNALHEIAMIIKDVEQLENVQQDLKSTYPDLLIENYREIAPDVQLYESQIYVSLSILLAIFMLALIFGIINTMLMAVLERTRELGMLMAIGMNRIRVFFMIVMETLMLGIIGAPLGMLIGWLTVKYLNRTGIDLSGFAKGIERFGMDTVIYPSLDTEMYLQLMVSVLITALLASVYPAIKAIRLRPMEAIRKL